MRLYEAQNAARSTPLRFGSIQLIEARDLLRVKADIDAILWLLRREGFKYFDLPCSGRIGFLWDSARLREYRDELLSFARKQCDARLNAELARLSEGAA